MFHGSDTSWLVKKKNEMVLQQVELGMIK